MDVTLEEASCYMYSAPPYSAYRFVKELDKILILAQLMHAMPPPVEAYPVLPNIYSDVTDKLTVSQYIDETGEEPEIRTLVI